MFFREKVSEAAPKIGDFAGTGRERRVQTFFVRHEHGQGDTGTPREGLQHLGRARHLRHPFGRDEASRLDGGQAGRDELLDERDPGGRRHRRRFVLQAVARPHLDNTKAFTHA